MVGVVVRGKASITFLAVFKINSKTLAYSTYFAVLAMIDVLIWVIVVEFTVTTEIFGKRAMAVHTLIRGWLSGPAVHAHHFFCVESDDEVVGLVVVAEAAREESSAAVGLKLAPTAIVLAAHYALFFIEIRRFGLRADLRRHNSWRLEGSGAHQHLYSP